MLIHVLLEVSINELNDRDNAFCLLVSVNRISYSGVTLGVCISDLWLILFM